MKKISRLLIALLLLSGAFSARAQGIAIGDWRDHYPYTKGLAVAEGPDKVYCMTLGGLFSYHKTDFSIERLSKVTGLSDVEYSNIAYNKGNDVLVIAYKNANIDLVEKDGKVTNLSDIKRANIIGNKTINSIYIKDQYAYMACGFGIVVVDTDRKEVKDTYYIGPNGGMVNVYDITTDGNNIYAAAFNGIYSASLSSNLSLFSSWSKFSGLPNGVYNTITSFNGKVYANYSKALSTPSEWAKDTIYIYENSTWTPFSNLTGEVIWSLGSFNNKLVVVVHGRVIHFDASHTATNNIFSYTFSYASPQDAVLDANGKTWIADSRFGLVDAIDPWTNSYRFPNGPEASYMPTLVGAYRMAAGQNNVCFVPGNITAEWNNTYTFGSFSSFSDETWTTVDGDNYGGLMDSLLDLLAIAVHPTDDKRIFVGSWGGGLIEFNNGTFIKAYDNTNSSLSARPTDASWVGVAGIDFDSENNLWASNSFVTNGISVMRSNGTWQSYSLSPYSGSTVEVGDLLVDKLNQKWILLGRSKGLLVFDETKPAGSQVKKLSTSIGSGALPSNEVLSIAEDRDGEIWLGTDKGIAVIYSPELVFTNSNFDAQQIIIEQDGHFQILLETEAISDIVVDGANRKWIATQNAGVFLMSADGTEEIHHFDVSNSPLPTNEVTSIAINPSTGEVFFGTAKGVVSYKGTATEGLDEYGQVYAYPNPVRPGYDGLIAIRGLVTDAEVKITDITGNLVYSTRAEGGQATWNGRNFKGEKAHTGVYIVFCSDAEGKKTYVTKIVIVN